MLWRLPVLNCFPQKYPETFPHWIALRVHCVTFRLYNTMTTLSSWPLCSAIACTALQLPRLSSDWLLVSWDAQDKSTTQAHASQGHFQYAEERVAPSQPWLWQQAVIAAGARERPERRPWLSYSPIVWLAHISRLPLP